MNKRFGTFDVFCLSMIGILGLATAYLWRGEIVGAAQRTSEVSDVAVVQRSAFNEQLAMNNEQEIQDRDQGTGNNEQKATSTSEGVIVGDNDTMGQLNNEKEFIVLVDTDELPKSINLAVPFTSQAPEKNWDQPWQDACEEAAFLMLDAYYKEYNLSPLFAKDEMQKMVDWEEEVKKWGRSIEIKKIQQLAAHYADDEYRIVENPTVEDIKQFVASGDPVYVVADGKVLPNKHFQNGGPEYHALIVRGYTETHFITNDPGTQFGENYIYTYDELMHAIRDWNGGDVKTGKRLVMVRQ